MGGIIEMNGALQISVEQGFPVNILDVKKHHNESIKIENIQNKIFEFRGKDKARMYQVPPSRNFLIQNLKGKWIYWGMVEIIEQKICSTDEGSITSGKFKLISIFEPENQIIITKSLSRVGCSYF